MRITGICTAFHEADIIGYSVRHMLSEGCDEVIVECPTDDDETAEVAKNAGAKVLIEDEEYHDQPATINRIAAEIGDGWIIPWDADEFFYSPVRSQTIRETLETWAKDAWVIECPRFTQFDWWHSEPGPSGMNKVVYRWSPDIKVGPGNHTVTGVAEGALKMQNGLFLREMQYRGFDHFKRKVEERSRTIDPSFGPEMGWHIRQYAGHSEADLEKDYAKEMRGTYGPIWAPLPTHIEIPGYDGPRLDMRDLMYAMAEEPCDIAGHLGRLYDLVSETGGGPVLELGVNTGMSTIAFLASKAEVYSVDYAFDVRRTVRPEVLAAPNWHLSIADDRTFEPPFTEWPLIFIDTSHTYRHTLEELAKYWPMVKPGGAMAWHDTLPGDQARAHAHWEHTVTDIDHKEMYTHSNGLGIWWKKK